jgi:two-component system, cell cycle sensor histidine kinase and response regulator CckA
LTTFYTHYVNLGPFCHDSSQISSKIMPPEKTRGNKYSPSLLLAFIAAGLAGNYLSFPLFLNVDFLFGSIFAMLALQFFGVFRGILAATIIAGYTYYLWNHPYAIIIMTAEVGIVGWWLKHKDRGFVLVDALFWLILGMPLVFFFYHIIMNVSLHSTYIVMAKQAVNGIANSLIARLIFTGLILRSKSSLISYGEIMCNLFSLFILCPTLIIIGVDSRKDFSEADNRIRAALVQDCRLMHEYFNTWVEHKESNIVNLAEMAAEKIPHQIQPYLELSRKSDNDFLRIGLLDKEATVVAYSPLIDELGQENVGKNFADRPYIKILKSTLRPMLSEVVMGRIGAPRPIVQVLAPVIQHGEYGGYVTGIISLENLRNHLEKRMHETAMLYTLIDKNGNVVITSRTDQKIMTPYVLGEGTSTHFDDQIDQWIPVQPPNVSIMERWKKSSYVAETMVGEFAEWKLIIEQPVAPFQKALNDKYTRKLIILLLIVLGAILLAELIGHKSIQALVKLSFLTHDLPFRLETGNKEIFWPASGILEIDQLICNFEKMTNSLIELFDNVKKVNDSLESRVNEQTAELKASHERYRSILDASPDNITITDIDGKIQMISPAGQKAFGFSKQEDVLGRPITELIVPEDRNRAWSNFNLHLQKHFSGPAEFQGIRSDGSIFEIEIMIDFIRNSEKKPTGAVFVIRDITRRKLAAEELRASEAKSSNAYSLMRQLCDNVPDMIWAKDMEGHYTFANEAICRGLLNAADTSEPIGKFDMFFAERERALHADNPEWHTFGEICEDSDAITIKSGMPHQFDEFGNVQGKFLFLDVHKVPIRDGNGKIIGTVGSARDVTLAKDIEKKLRDSEARLSAAAKAAKFGVYSYDFRSGNAHYSSEFLLLFGLRPGTHPELDEDLTPLALHPDDKIAFLTNMKAANDPCGAGIFELEYRIIRHDGQVRWLKVMGQTYFSGNQKHDHPVYSYGIIYDISERKIAEKALQKAYDEMEERVLERTADLEKTNATLLMMLDYARKAEKDIEERVVANLRSKSMIIIELLKKEKLPEKVLDLVKMLEITTQDLAHPLARNLNSQLWKLTAREIELANLIRMGKTTKEMISLLNLSAKTIETHRNNLRKKLGINNKKINLRTFLSSEFNEHP